jgi:hypothetical protein
MAAISTVLRKRAIGAVQYFVHIFHFKLAIDFQGVMAMHCKSSANG